MNLGAEDRKKLIAAGAFGLLAVGSLLYELTGSGGSSAPSAPAPVTVVSTAPPESTRTVSPAAVATARVIPSRLDPTLHPEGMLLTESLVYTGSGRNIFLAGPSPADVAAVKIPKPVATPRFVPPAPVHTGPPPLPNINLRFFGTATRRDGSRQAFLLQGEDVFVASPGDVVARRYRIGTITLTSIQVTDLTNNNTQQLPVILR